MEPNERTSQYCAAKLRPVLPWLAHSVTGDLESIDCDGKVTIISIGATVRMYQLYDGSIHFSIGNLSATLKPEKARHPSAHNS